MKIVWKGFKYMSYLTVLCRSHKKVLRRLIFFSPPTECFYEHALSIVLNTL